MTPDLRTGSMPLWIEIFVRILGRPADQVTLIDLCCGRMGNTGLLRFGRSLHVDLTDYDERPRSAAFLKHDVLTLSETLDGLFDVALCSDGIEHLSKPDGMTLIDRMVRLSPRQIIFTPLGEYMVDPGATSPEAHRSGWVPEDFPTGWDTQVFPNWHPTLNIGALWAWHTND